VAFRDRPTFWGREASQDGVGGRGHDVPIDEYSVEELRKVIRFSVSVLNKNGFQGIRSFRAGGWMAGPSVLAALAAEGFVADSSAVPPDLLVDRVGGTPLHQRAQALWSHISRFSQPYAITTELGGSLTEFPDNACLADYVIGDQVVQLFRRMADQPASRGVPILHYGFHQETAAEYLIRVEESLELIDKAAKEKGVTWSSEVLLGAP
jgi:hypothetical protein